MFPEGREYHLLQVSWQTRSQPTRKAILFIIKRNFFTVYFANLVTTIGEQKLSDKNL